MVAYVGGEYAGVHEEDVGLGAAGFAGTPGVVGGACSVDVDAVVGRVVADFAVPAARCVDPAVVVG